MHAQQWSPLAVCSLSFYSLVVRQSNSDENNQIWHTPVTEEKNQRFCNYLHGETGSSLLRANSTQKCLVVSSDCQFTIYKNASIYQVQVRPDHNFKMAKW